MSEPTAGVSFPQQSRAFELLETLGTAAAEISPPDIPRFVGELERLKADVWRRLAVPPVAAAAAGPVAVKGAVLTPAETASRLGRSSWWVRQHRHELPLVRLPGGRYGFSEAGLERWVRRRSS